MSWFRREENTIEGAGESRVRTEGLWIKCDGCGQIIWKAELDANLQVCPKCGFHFKMGEEKKLKGQATGTELPQDRPSFLIPAAYGSCSWPSTSTSLTDAPHPKMVFNPLFASQVHQSSCFQPTQTENKTVTPFARSLYNYYNNAQSPDRDKCVLHHSIAPAPVRGGSTAADVDVDAVDIYRKE